MYLFIHNNYIDTSDVQAARVVATGDSNRVRVECDFILGSDADGCVVVLLSTGEVDNTTLNSTRENNSSQMAVTQLELPSPLHCYNRVYALDVESDGSIGSLPVPGVLDLADTDTAVSCSPMDTRRSLSEHTLIAPPPPPPNTHTHKKEDMIPQPKPYSTFCTS